MEIQLYILLKNLSVLQSEGETQLTNRWEMIQNALNKPIRNSKELANTILSYNTQFKKKWKFATLHYLFEEVSLL